ncbi:MAG: type IX secretion system membrane protein PorP/SprF [Salibacteraceae bacterium]
MSLTVDAQQTWQVTQYMSNAYLVNPATAGEREMLDLNVSFRQQWLGSQYAPRTFYVSGTSQIFAPRKVNSTTLPTSSDYQPNKKGKLRHAVGGIVLQDQFGAFSYTSFGASYNVHVPLSKSWTLSTALKATAKNWVFDPSKTQTGTAQDPTLSAFAANSQAFNDWIPSIDFGVYAYSRYLFFSYASDQLTQGELQFENAPVSPALQMTHYGMVGGRIPLNQATHIVPSTLIKYTAVAPPSVDVNVKLDVQDRYFIAAGYRWNSDITLTGAVFVSDLVKVGYSFDYPITETRSLGFGSHELFLGIELFKK